MHATSAGCQRTKNQKASVHTIYIHNTYIYIHNTYIYIQSILYSIYFREDASHPIHSAPARIYGREKLPRTCRLVKDELFRPIYTAQIFMEAISYDDETAEHVCERVRFDSKKHRRVNASLCRIICIWHQCRNYDSWGSGSPKK